MKVRAILVAATLALMVAPLPSQAAPQTKQYVAGPGYTIVGPRSELPSVNGVVFRPNVDPTKLRVNDSNAGLGKVLFKACQPACGDTSPIRQAYCVNNGTTVTLPAGMNATDPIYVFIYTEETVNTLWVGGISCPEALGTTGTIALT
jgi:hypothetical protein